MQKLEIRVSTQLSWKVLLAPPPPLSCGAQRCELIGHVLQPHAEPQLWSCKTCTSISVFYVCRKSLKAVATLTMLVTYHMSEPLTHATGVFNFLRRLHQFYALTAPSSTFLFIFITFFWKHCKFQVYTLFLKHHISELILLLFIFIIMCHKRS